MDNLRGTTHGFEYWAFSPSNANLTLLDILTYFDSRDGLLGTKTYIYALEYKSFTSLKISRPHGLPCEEKTVSPQSSLLNLKT
jgi:hypothetical protein